MSREAFQEAADFFLSVVRRVPEDRWESPGLGVWNLRELVGHTGRAMTSIETYADSPVEQVEVASPVDYFMLAQRTVGTPEAVAQRGRDAGRDLGADPIAAMTETARRVLGRLEHMSDDALLGVPVGGMRLMDYLPTRVQELTIHSLDIANALNIEAEPPPRAMALTLHLLADRALRLGQGPLLALATTGRCSLPPGFTLV